MNAIRLHKNAMIVVFTVLLSASLAGNAHAGTKALVTEVGIAEPRSFLLVGNSFMFYNNGMHSMLRRLLRAADPENSTDYRATSVTISGSGLDWHDVESYFRPDALAQYSFIAGNKVRFNDFERLFDIVIMMDCSQCPIHPQLQEKFHEYAAKHSATVTRHGGRPVFFMTWAYEDKPDMTAQLAEQYTIAGNANNALVVPAGIAFATARSGRPELELYQRDRRHPSLEGTYLAALTIYASVMNKRPPANYVPDGIDPDSAAYLQNISWEVVQEFLGG